MHSGRMIPKRAPVVLALVLFAYSLAALAQGTVEVVVENYAYSPREVNVRVGDTVSWTNREKRTSHSILFPAENGLESDRIFPGESWQRVFTKPGIYPYTCGPHPEMKGRVLVSE